VSTFVAIDPVMVKPKEKAKTSLLPVLVVLFLISYGLLTLLVVEQNRTIAAQRTLIGQLYSDSLQLTAMKGKAAREQAEAKAKLHTQAQDPSVQVNPQSKEKNAGNLRRQLLQKPKGVQDNPDSRRELNQI
jgi:Tfp pilus assembly protein PilV